MKAKQSARKQVSVPVAHGVGRRKASVARVWLRKGAGVMKINDRDYMEYFTTENMRLSASHPFRVVNETRDFDVEVNVMGGGLAAQADAVKAGFARALLQLNSDVRPQLRQAGLLTIDSRLKERKKYGRKAARRRFQFVKR